MKKAFVLARSTSFQNHSIRGYCLPLLLLLLKQLLKVVSHTPIECEKLTAARISGGWVDAMRELVPEPRKLYTWWSYRAQDWEASDRGRRLDHVWSSPNLVPSFAGYQILRLARGWERPSDHVPVIARFDLD
jgi:exodeoxyribonuclease-3